MSSIQFLLIIDWIMRRTTPDSYRVMNWKLLSYLEILDFADDITILSFNHLHPQMQTNRVDIYVKQTDLVINIKKTESMYINTTSPRPLPINEDDIFTADIFAIHKIRQWCKEIYRCEAAERSFVVHSAVCVLFGSRSSQTGRQISLHNTKLSNPSCMVQNA